jgi:hypothetical protein
VNLKTQRSYNVKTRLALRVLGVLLGVAVCGGLWFVHSISHRVYKVDAELHVNAPGPVGLKFPAVVCVWANSFRAAIPDTATNYDPAREDAGTSAYVVCHVPQGGVGIPIHAALYSTTGRGFLIGAFLRPIPDGHSACSSPDTAMAVVSDPEGTLGELCSTGRLPKPDVALMAPFDDDKGRPTRTLRIVVSRAE